MLKIEKVGVPLPVTPPVQLLVHLCKQPSSPLPVQLSQGRAGMGLPTSAAHRTGSSLRKPCRPSTHPRVGGEQRAHRPSWLIVSGPPPLARRAPGQSIEGGRHGGSSARSAAQVPAARGLRVDQGGPVCPPDPPLLAVGKPLEPVLCRLGKPGHPLGKPWAHRPGQACACCGQAWSAGRASRSALGAGACWEGAGAGGSAGSAAWAVLVGGGAAARSGSGVGDAELLSGGADRAGFDLGLAEGVECLLACGGPRPA